jgi:hypothetical protein
MIQKPFLWVEVGKSACVLVGICNQSLSLFARYDPQCPSLLDFLSGCLVRVLWIVGLRQILHGLLNRSRPIAEIKERRAIFAANANANADTPTNNP